MIDDSVIEALNFLLKIVLYSGAFASPLVILILLMYGYERYKKWTKKETKQKEQIIVKMNKQIKDDALACDTLSNKKTQLQVEVEKLQKEKHDLNAELGKPEEVIVEEEKIEDYSKLTIKELKALAKQKGIPRYSKMSKATLLEMLMV